MTDLTSLLEKLEKAEGPDREMDGHIHNTVFGTAYVFAPHSVTGFLTSATNNGCPTVAGYTSSIDAAVSLAERVLPGWDWGTQSFGDDGAQGKVWKNGWHDDTVVGADHDSPVIALLLATLRALQQKGSSNDHA